MKRFWLIPTICIAVTIMVIVAWAIHGSAEPSGEQAYLLNEPGKKLVPLEEFTRPWREQLLADTAAMAPIDAAQYVYDGYRGSEWALDLVVDKVNAAVEYDPLSFQARMLRGWVRYQRQHDYGGAVEDYQKAVDLDPANGEARLNLARTLFLDDRLADCRVQAAKALDLGYEPVSCTILIGLTYRTQGDYVAALEHFEKALELSPDSSKLKADVAFLRSKIAEAEAAPVPSARLDNALLPNFPNPANPETWIPFQLATDADVRITIFNPAGELVRTLDLGPKRAGKHDSRATAAHWDGRNEQGEIVASGLYIYRFEAVNYTASGRVLVAK